MIIYGEYSERNRVSTTGTINGICKFVNTHNTIMQISAKCEAIWDFLKSVFRTFLWIKGSKSSFPWNGKYKLSYYLIKRSLKCWIPSRSSPIAGTWKLELHLFSPIKMMSLSTDCPFHLEVHHFGGADLTGYGGFNTFVTCAFTKLLKGC